jgi:hypothetical protein
VEEAVAGPAVDGELVDGELVDGVVDGTVAEGVADAEVDDPEGAEDDAGFVTAAGGVSFERGRVAEGEEATDEGTMVGGGNGTLSGTWGRSTTWSAATRPWLLA